MSLTSVGFNPYLQTCNAFDHAFPVKTKGWGVVSWDCDLIWDDEFKTSCVRIRRNASMTPYLAVSMALLAGQAALTCLPALGSLSGSALSLAAGGLAIASVAPLVRELPAVRAKLGAARARRSRRAS